MHIIWTYVVYACICMYVITLGNRIWMCVRKYACMHSIASVYYCIRLVYEGLSEGVGRHLWAHCGHRLWWDMRSVGQSSWSQRWIHPALVPRLWCCGHHRPSTTGQSFVRSHWPMSSHSARDSRPPSDHRSEQPLQRVLWSERSVSNQFSPKDLRL